MPARSWKNCGFRRGRKSSRRKEGGLRPPSDLQSRAMPASFGDETRRISRQTEGFKTFWIDRSGNHPDERFAELGGHHRQISLVFQGVLQGSRLCILLVMVDSYLRRSVVLCCAEKGGEAWQPNGPMATDWCESAATDAGREESLWDIRKMVSLSSEVCSRKPRRN